MSPCTGQLNSWLRSGPAQQDPPPHPHLPHGSQGAVWTEAAAGKRPADLWTRAILTDHVTF